MFDSLHYLALIETKEARMGIRGKREFIQVLRLIEAIPKGVVASAVTEAIRLGAIGFDAARS